MSRDERNTERPFPHYGQMVKGYKYAKPLSFDAQYGHLASGQFPADCISSCSASGSVDEAVEHWVSRLDLTSALEPVRHLVESFLQEYGAWDDLREADISTLANRILWLACCDIREQGEWYGLSH
jgi:hypothetical protein